MNDPGAELRRGESADLGLLVALAETDGRDPTVMRRAFETDIGGSDRLLLVAMAGGELAGYGRPAVPPIFGPAPTPHSCSPRALLPGRALVATRWRRRGIAEALTQARMTWAFEHAAVVWYLIKARDTASLALHGTLGFVEVTRSFSFPRVSFAGDVGVLGRARADSLPAQRLLDLEPKGASDGNGVAGAQPGKAARPVTFSLTQPVKAGATATPWS